MSTNQMGLASKSKLTAIANAIRTKLGVSTQYSLDDMPSAIASIGGGGGGGITPTGTIQITENGTFDVTQYASAAVNVSGGGSSGGWELLSEFTASEDVATINIEVPSAKRGMNVYKVELTGETSVSEWIYLHANTSESSLSGAYFSQKRTYSDAFFASKRGYGSGGYSVSTGSRTSANTDRFVTTEDIQNFFLNLYASESTFKNGFNVKLYGID